MAPKPTDQHDVAIDAHSGSALATTKQNLRYLYDPKAAGAGAVSSRRTRAALRVLRSSLIFIFWRVVRYAKYVAIGSFVATIGAGAMGTFMSGAGFVLAPTGIAGTIIASSVWGIGRFAVRRVKKRWGAGYGSGEAEAGAEARSTRVAQMERGPEAIPW
ncbi:uncharacterized protein M421DRAFT_75045 [Didymella exigua CBS 183.55]|uniref:Uncharacterized protein n=1 Tax=Didymella exigua CBS 183.55 TaxID=1150837 RepID=A0A6A5R7D3_9PLEO|nr:uncharacterized protein M421DRAFT_75045 [Didymella exigua CBS 183.55]KAF1923533.1 hypothetical protein M421DRAFT_75045 [Didymella exigua CBS 183.55]